MAATNLNEYYTGKGQALPSLQERAKTYETSGLGKATDYQGTAQQNTSLLGKLTAAPAAPAAPAATQIPTGATLISGPSGLAGLTKNDVYKDPNSLNIYRLPTTPASTKPVVPEAPPRNTNIDAPTGTAGSVPDQTSAPDLAHIGISDIATNKMTELEKEQAAIAQQRTALDEKQKADAQAQVDAERQGLATASNFDRTGLIDSLKQKEQLDQKEKAIVDIQGQMADANAVLNSGLISLENQPGVILSAIRGQQARLRQQAAAEITALSAKADIVQGQYDRAYKRVGDYYDAAVAENTSQINRYDKLLELDSAKIVDLTKDERDQLDTQKDLLKTQQDRINKDREAVLALIQAEPEAFAKANVTLDMSLEEITKKVAAAKVASSGTLSPAQVLQQVTDLYNKYPDSGINPGVDTLATASAKLKNSRLYNKASEKSAGSGGGVGSSNLDVTTIAAKLNASRGDDGKGVGKGYVNTDVYKAERSKVKDKASFDKYFSYLLNPADASAQALIPGKEPGQTVKYDATNIPGDVQTDILSDVLAQDGNGNYKVELQDLLNAYPDVNSNYIATIFTKARGQ